jgi:hypothetical protein
VRIFHVARVIPSNKKITGYPIISIVYLHHVDADPDSTYQPDAVPYSDSLFDADPDPTFLPDADPELDPSFKKRLKPLNKC